MSSDSKYFAGVDIGASAAKAVIIDSRSRLTGWAVTRSGADFAKTAEHLLDQTLTKAGLTRERIQTVVATGYGRRNVYFAELTRTEISCHAAGCYHFFPRAINVIDIGGQDNKIIKLDRSGARISFKMNRKCAAGTGAFLEEMALRLDLPLEDLDGLARRTRETVELGSFCTVFTATEVLEKIRAGHKVEGIVRGLYSSIAKRVLEMDTIDQTPVMSGGVIEHNPILKEIFSDKLEMEVLTPPQPQLMGAFGAALFAAGLHQRPGNPYNQDFSESFLKRR